MATPIQAQLILCDAAQSERNGKIHMLGAGWSRTGTPTAPMALAVLLKIPWDRANEKIKVVFSLITEDGKPVTIPSPQGPQEIRMESDIEAGRPPGLKHGTPIDASFALNVASMPLPPGGYEWRMDLSGEVTRAPFSVLARI